MERSGAWAAGIVVIYIYLYFNIFRDIEYLEEGCDFVHEFENISHVDKGYVEDSTCKHEEDGVEVLYLGVVNNGGNDQVEADQHHHNRDDNWALQSELDTILQSIYEVLYLVRAG